MKRNYFLILCTLILFYSCSGGDKTAYTKLILDDKYSQIQKEGTTIVPQNYEIESSNGFVLDCSKYDFSLIRQMNKGKDPDMIHVISKAGTFVVNLNAKGETIVDNTSMHSLDENNKVFTGFIKGDTAILAIGTLNLDKGISEMMTYWLGRAVIK